MKALDLPEDLASFLRAAPSLALQTRWYGTIRLVPLNELQVDTLELTPNVSPFAEENPHYTDYGYYPIPAVNLVAGSPRRNVDFPAWQLLWLPNERRYGAYDLDHRDVLMFGSAVSWSDIVQDPQVFILAGEGGDDGPVSVEYLKPWPRYPFIRVKGK